MNQNILTATPYFCGIFASLALSEDSKKRLIAAESLKFSQHSESSLERMAQIMIRDSNIPVIKQLAQLIAQQALPESPSRKLLDEYVQQCAHPDLCAYLRGL